MSPGERELKNENLVFDKRAFVEFFFRSQDMRQGARSSSGPNFYLDFFNMRKIFFLGGGDRSSKPHIDLLGREKVSHLISRKTIIFFTFCSD